MENYKPNSYKSKEGQRITNTHKSKEGQEEKRDIKPVVSAPAKKKKKSGLVKFTDVFIQEDISNVKEFIISDVLIPTFKKLALDIVESVLYPGEGSNRSNRAPGSKVSYTSYDKAYRNDDRFAKGSNRVNTYDYDNISFTSRRDAEAVLMAMDDVIDRYGIVRVADYYEFSGVTGSYTDNNYGWTNLSTARVDRTRDGYVIRLPRPMTID